MRAIVDTGPLVTFFNRAEQHHRWAADRIAEIDRPLLICEPVITETLFLLARFSRPRDALFGLLQNGAIRLAFQLSDHAVAVHRLMDKYRDTPMSLADACVVRMAEMYDEHSVLTLDSDFTAYRKHGRMLVPPIYPKPRSPGSMG